MTGSWLEQRPVIRTIGATSLVLSIFPPALICALCFIALEEAPSVLRPFHSIRADSKRDVTYGNIKLRQIELENFTGCFVYTMIKSESIQMFA